MANWPPEGMDRARRLKGGRGTGEGLVGLVENGYGMPDAKCETCEGHAVLYFVDTAEQFQHFACLEHAGAIAYDVAVASTADPNIPASERGADDRRWRKRSE